MSERQQRIIDAITGLAAREAGEVKTAADVQHLYEQFGIELQQLFRNPQALAAALNTQRSARKAELRAAEKSDTEMDLDPILEADAPLSPLDDTSVLDAEKKPGSGDSSTVL